MKFENFKSNVTRKIGKCGLVLKKHSPEILMAFGTVGIITSGVLACKATTKISDIKSDYESQLKDIEDVKKLAKNEDVEYSSTDAKNDIKLIKTQTVIKYVKLYAPSVTLGMTSLACMLAANNILRKRVAALGAAYTTLNNTFSEYRKRVSERYGEDAEKEIRYNIKAEKIKNENGETEEVNVVDPSTIADTSRFFDASCDGWSKDPEANLRYLKIKQAVANDMLKSRGYLFLNEVYKLLDIPRTKVGHVAGWIYNEENPVGDNYVDFGLYNPDSMANRRFVNGLEPVVLLDFNIDGNIYDLI